MTNARWSFSGKCPERSCRWLISIALVIAVGCASPPKAAKEAVGQSAIEETLQIPTEQLMGEATETAGETAGETEPAAAAAAGEPATPPPAREYRIGAGDILEFRSFDDPNLSQDIVVRYDGHISLPLVHDVMVAGDTREEALTKVEQAYLEVFKDPQVSLAVRSAASKGYYVMGDVMQPNRYPYEQAITVVEAINRAGGTRVTGRGTDDYAPQQGTLTKAFIIRGHGKDRDIIECDLRQLTYPGAHPADTAVYPGDFVYVPEGVNLVYVLGEVQRPTVFQLAEGQTLVQLLARAGGPVQTTARLRNVVLIREMDEEHSEVMSINVARIFRTGRDMPLKPGDVIYVPRKPLVNLQEFVNRFTGSITPLLNLYNLAWDTKYTEKRLRVLFDQNLDTGTDADFVNLLQNARSFGSLIENYISSVPQPPAIPETP